jgi:hypothetical protein
LPRNLSDEEELGFGRVDLRLDLAGGEEAFSLMPATSDKKELSF